MTDTETSGTEGQGQCTLVESSKPVTASEDFPTPLEASTAEEANQAKVSVESGDIYALKALKEAWETVGFIDFPDGHFSFADVGNPAMALTAFLAKLVEPDVVTVSARSSLKSISDVSSSMQLAARHCFIPEDPPDENKEKTGPGSAVAEDAQKDGNGKEENAAPVTHQSTLPNYQAEKKTNDCISEEKKSLVSPDSNGNGKSMAAEVRDSVATSEKVGHTNMDESQKTNMPNVNPPGASRESVKLTPNVDIPSSSVKESGDKPSEPGTEAAKNADMVIDSLPLEKDPAEPVSSVTDGENRAKKAAAVKAKLFVDQEEDQILEKLLHKLEAKLVFFSEMDNVVLKTRELMERLRQKLYQERAQIIASRLGLPASSSRAMLPQSFPNDMNFANTVPRPPTGMAFQRPPLARPTMSSASFMSSSFASSMVSRNSVRPLSQDKVSSVGTK